MVRLALSEQEAALLEGFGARVFLRARAHLDAGDVVDLRWEPQTGQLHGTAVLDRHLPGAGVGAIMGTGALYNP